MFFSNVEVAPDSTWGVVRKLGLEIDQGKLSPDQVIVYGSADPLPNPAELLLTQLVVSHQNQPWKFFVYIHGRNLEKVILRRVDEPERKVNELQKRYNLPIFCLEDIIPEGLTLGEMSRRIFEIRKDDLVVARLWDNTPLRATVDPERNWFGNWASREVSDLHKCGGWLGGAGIHYVLRLLAQEDEKIVYLCPFQRKGLVYKLYSGFQRPLFLCVPFLRFVPPRSHRAGQCREDWVPLSWEEWEDLSPLTRESIENEVKKRLSDGGERRIEIQVP